MFSLSGQFHSWTSFLVLLSIQVISADELDLRQTIPASGIACPGKKVQYMCTSPKNEISWTVGSSQPVGIDGNMEMNSSKNIGDFFLYLSAKNATSISSIATNYMVTSTYDGLQIACYSGTKINSTTIDIADGPANCSNLFVVPECRATTNAIGDTEFSITLPNATNLTCVEGYQIQFNGESENVLLSSPSANFTISNGEQVPNAILTYTLDYEERTSQKPCNFTIAAPKAVEKFLEPECNAKALKNVDVTFHWMAAVVGGCLESNVPLRYLVEFNDTWYEGIETESTNYVLTNVTPKSVLEIAITPRVHLPFLGQAGPPFSSTVSLATITCSTSSSSSIFDTPPMTASIPATSNPTSASGDDNIAVYIFGSFTVAALLVVIMLAVSFSLFMVYYCTQQKNVNQIKDTVDHILGEFHQRRQSFRNGVRDRIDDPDHNSSHQLLMPKEASTPERTSRPTFSVTNPQYLNGMDQISPPATSGGHSLAVTEPQQVNTMDPKNTPTVSDSGVGKDMKVSAPYAEDAQDEEAGLDTGQEGNRSQFVVTADPKVPPAEGSVMVPGKSTSVDSDQGESSMRETNTYSVPTSESTC